FVLNVIHRPPSFPHHRQFSPKVVSTCDRGTRARRQTRGDHRTQTLLAREREDRLSYARAVHGLRIPDPGEHSNGERAINLVNVDDLRGSGPNEVHRRPRSSAEVPEHRKHVAVGSQDGEGALTEVRVLPPVTIASRPFSFL